MKLTRRQILQLTGIRFGLLSLVIAFCSFLYWRFVPHAPRDGVSTTFLVLNFGAAFYYVGYTVGRRNGLRDAERR